MDRRRGLRRPDRPPRRKDALDLDDVIYGVHAIEEALSAEEAVRRLYVGDERKRDPALRKLLERASALGVPVRYESRSFFSQFPYRAHQSVIGFGQPFDYVTLEDALALDGASGGKLYVVLDHITDPHNAGAIIRSAECAGATAVVIPERRAAGVNATVRKTAAGATAHLPVARVANVEQWASEAEDGLIDLRRAGAFKGKGTLLQKIDLGGPISASPAVSGGYLVIGTEKGAIYCLGAKK